MIDGLKVSLVIPCRNEEETLGELLQSIPPEVDEVVIADNRSKDRTAAIATAHGAIVVNEPRVDAAGIGYGYALQSGIGRSTGDIIVTMDADGTYPVFRVPALVHELVERNLDFISCRRLPRLEPEDKLWIRIAGVVALNVATRVLYGYPMRDSLSGMNVFRRERFASIPFNEGGWNFCLELKLAALVNPAIRFAEVHIPYHDRVDNNLSKQQIFKTGFGHLWYLFRYRWTKVRRATSRPRAAMVKLGEERV